MLGYRQYTMSLQSSLPSFQAQHLKYRADIDGLRAIAVLLVVFFHAYPKALPGGFIGVDIFFIISGYLITGILINSLSLKSFSFVDFYSRRIKRIFPALLLVLIFCLVFGWFALLNDEYRELGKHALAGAGFYSNLLLWSESGYFDLSSNLKPLLHLWSLGIEEQFYLVWPILVWITWKKPRLFLLLLIVLIFSSFSFNLYFLNIDSIGTFYSPFTRLWELLLGGLLAAFHSDTKWNRLRPSALQANVLGVLGLTLIVLAAIYFSKHSKFPGWLACLPTFGTALIIFAGPIAWVNQHLLSNRILVWFGLISFPLYLWHWPLISFANLIEGEETHSYIKTRLVLLSIFLSWITYRFIERPIRLSQFNSAYFLAAIMSIIGVLGWTVYHNDGYPLRNSISTTTLTPQARDQIGNKTWEYIKNNKCLTSYPLEESEKYAWWFCMKQDDRKPTTIILGNSYANQLYPGFIKNPLLKNQSFLSIGACPIGFENNNSTLDKNNPCSGNRPAEQNQFINQIIASEGSFKYAILDGLEENLTPQYIQRVRNRIDELEKLGLTVIVFTPRARLGFDPKLCYTTPFRKESRDCTISKSHLDEMRRSFEPFALSIKSSNPKVLIFDQNVAFCTNDHCSHLLHGIPLSRDAGHMSEFGSVNLQNRFIPWIVEYIPDFASK